MMRLRARSGIGDGTIVIMHECRVLERRVTCSLSESLLLDIRCDRFLKELVGVEWKIRRMNRIVRRSCFVRATSKAIKGWPESDLPATTRSARFDAWPCAPSFDSFSLSPSWRLALPLMWSFRLRWCSAIGFVGLSGPRKEPMIGLAQSVQIR
jgi:hypothetical protein